MPIHHKPVFSGHIETIGYDSASGALHVAYQGGKTAIYKGVPPGLASSVMNAPSVGAAMHQHIRGRFEHSYQEG